MSDAVAEPIDPQADGTITDREARAAVLVLRDVASEFNRTITYGELKDQVGIITHRPSNQLANTWADRVLNRVIRICEETGDPQLTALVVRASGGGVGEGFNEILIRSGRDPIDNPQQLEMVAAEERLNCYRQYCPNLPDDAKPMLTNVYRAHVERLNKPEPREALVCATHGIQLPSTGVCDDCA